MVHIYVEYQLGQANLKHYAVCLRIPSTPDIVVDFVKSNINTKMSKGFHNLEYSTNLFFEFNSVLSTQQSRILVSSEKHIYIVSRDMQTNIFAYVTKLNQRQYEFVYNNGIEMSNTNIRSITTDASNKQYHYLIGFTTPQTFETVLEYLYSSEMYSDAMVKLESNLAEKSQNSLEYVIDTNSNSIIQASRVNAAYVYSLLSDRSVESIKTYHDASNRITQSHYSFEADSIDSNKPKVYLEGNVGQIQNMSVFSVTKSVSKYYTFVTKTKDYFINKYTLPSFVSSITSLYDLDNLVNHNDLLNNTLYFCNNMSESLHSNVSFVIEYAFLDLNNPSNIEFIHEDNDYSYVLFATDDLNNTFDFYIDYADTSDSNVVYSITQNINHSNIEFTPYVSNIDFFYVLTFDLSEPSVISDINTQNSALTNVNVSDDIEYKITLNNNDVVHSSYGDIHLVSKLFDGISNYSNLENSYISDKQMNGGVIVYEFTSGNVAVNSMEFVQPPLDYLSGNIDIFYYSNESSSFEPVSNVSHRGFDPETTVYNAELVVTFDKVTSSKFKIHIYPMIDENNIVGLSRWKLIKSESILDEISLSKSNIETFFTNHILGNIDTSIVGTHNNNVYFNYNTGLINTISIDEAFNSLETGHTNTIESNGEYSSYMIYRKLKTFHYVQVYPSTIPEDTFDWGESSQTEIVKTTPEQGGFDRCVLSRDGSYFVVSGASASSPGYVYIYKRNTDLTYTELQWDFPYDNHLLNFGYYASLSHDANYMIVTGPAVNYGAFYVFKNVNDTFVKHYELFWFKPEKQRHLYGMYNCISTDGKYMVVTATDDFNGGTVYVYKHVHNIIREIGTMKNDYRLNSTFGIKCAVSDHGEYIVVSGVRANNDGGTVLVYKNDGFDHYEVFADLSLSCSNYCQYGKDIAISGGGEIIVVSGNTTNTSGKCYIYRLNRYTKTYDSLHIIEKTETPGGFGTACDISTERHILVTGDGGTAFVFSSDDLFDTYTEVDLSENSNGVASCISRDGKHIAIGGPNANGGTFVIKNVSALHDVP